MSTNKSTSATSAEASGDGEYVKLELVNKSSPAVERRTEEGELLKDVLKVGRIEATQQLKEMMRAVVLKLTAVANKHHQCVQRFDKAVIRQCQAWAETDGDLKRVAVAMGKLIDSPVNSAHLVRHVRVSEVQGRVLRLHVELAFAVPFVSSSRDDTAFDDCDMSEGCELAYADASKLAGCEMLEVRVKMDEETYKLHTESIDLAATIEQLQKEEEELKERLRNVGDGMQALESRVLRQQITRSERGKKALEAMDAAVGALVSGKAYLNLMG